MGNSPAVGSYSCRFMFLGLHIWQKVYSLDTECPDGLAGVPHACTWEEHVWWQQAEGRPLHSLGLTEMRGCVSWAVQLLCSPYGQEDTRKCPWL